MPGRRSSNPCVLGDRSIAGVAIDRQLGEDLRVRPLTLSGLRLPERKIFKGKEIEDEEDVSIEGVLISLEGATY